MFSVGGLVTASIQGGAELKVLLFEGWEAVCCYMLLKYLNNNKLNFVDDIGLKHL